MERQTLSSRQNPLVKFVCGLADKKKRTESGLFRFDGIKLLGEACSAGLEIKYVIYRDPPSGQTEGILKKIYESELCGTCEVIAVTESVFEKLSEEHSPEGVLTVAKMPMALHTAAGDSLPSEGKRLLIAESLRDPGNLGTVIRSSYSLGIDTLILTDDCADIYNPRTVRAAMGAVFKLPTLTVARDMLPAYIESLRLQGRRVYATALSDDSVNIADIALRRGDCFVIGNEGHGLSEKCVSACTSSVIIPMREGAESLNAAAAAAICIWETVKV